MGDIMNLELAEQIAKLGERTLLEGAMATGALVATADARVLIQETLALATAAESIEQLKIHDTNLAITLHTRFIEQLREDPELGKEVAMRAVGACAGDLEAAEILLKVGITVAKADSVFSDDEIAVLEEICERLGISGLDALGLGGLRQRQRVN